MSAAGEIVAIETFIKANWTATTIGYIGQKFTPVDNSMLLSVVPGDVFQGTIGGTQTRVDYLSVLQAQIFTAGGKGEAVARGHAQTLITLLHGAILSASGALITTPADAFVRFSPKDDHPRISSVSHDAPFTIATVAAPFVRYEMI